MECTFATENDIEGILKIQDQIYRIENLAENAKNILSSLITREDCDVIVAKSENKILASAFVFYLPIPAHGKPYAFLEGLVVDQNERGKGIGTKLLEACEKSAKEKGCYKIIFTSGEDRCEAHNFYEKHGFKKQGFSFRKDLT